MDFNQAIIVGRLAGDPILKSYTKKDGTEGHRCFMSIAVVRRSDRGVKDRAERRTNFIPVVAWGEAAKRHATYLAKGTQVTISGEVIAESRKNADGSFTNFFSILANDVQYGARSRKGAAPMADAAAALQERTDELVGRTGDAADVAPAPVGGNPFREPMAA